MTQYYLSYLYVDAEMTQCEEVAGTCSNKDDINEACCTIRSLVIGFIFVVGISFLHQWTKYTYSSTYIGPVLTILLIYLFGRLWSLVIPNSKPFTQKEHGLAFIMTNISWMYFSVFNYATAATLQLLEKDKLNFINYFFAILAFQFLGFGLAGILRRFLVWPTHIIWPQNLPYIALLRTLHERKSSNMMQYYDATQKYNCYRLLVKNKLVFFFLIAVLAFIYEWLPLYIVPVLSVFSWMCIFNKKNYLLAQLTAVRGIALFGGGVTLDWLKITANLGSPLIVPAWALINIAFGFVLIVWLIVPIVYSSNVRNVQEHPIGGIMFPGLTAMNLVTAFLSFACIPAMFMHTVLFHGFDLWDQLRNKNISHMGNDMHARFVSLYKQVPDWCYLVLFAISLIIICVICDHNGWLKWYLVILSLAINVTLVLPFGLVASITGQFLQNAPVYYIGVIVAQSLSLGKESKSSYTFITVGYTLFVQTLALVQDMKFSHYLKIGHRPLFIAQCLAGFVCAAFSIGIQYMYFNIYGLNNQFDSSFSIFDYTLLGGSIYTDAVGFFSDGNTANPNRDLLWAFLVGTVLPIPGWLLSRWSSRFHWLKFLHWPLILNTLSWMPALLSAGALFTWLFIGFIVYLTVGKYEWTKRYIYLASAALDLGLNFTLIIVNIAFINREKSFPIWNGSKTNNGWDSCQLALTKQQ